MIAFEILIIFFMPLILAFFFQGSKTNFAFLLRKDRKTPKTNMDQPFKRKIQVKAVGKVGAAFAWWLKGSTLQDALDEADVI